MPPDFYCRACAVLYGWPWGGVGLPVFIGQCDSCHAEWAEIVQSYEAQERERIEHAE